MLPTKDTKLLGLFLRYLKPQRLWVSLSLLSIPLTTAATIFIPWQIVQIIDLAVVPGHAEGLQEMVWNLGLAVFGAYFFDAVYTYSLQRAGQTTIAAMRQDLFAHSLTLERSYFDKNPIGVTLSRITSDMETVSESLAIGVLGLITDLIKTTGLLILLMFLSWKLSLVILIILPPLYWIIAQLRYKLRSFYNITRESLAQATAYLAESLSGIKTIQLYAAEQKALANFSEKNQRFLRAQNSSNIYDAMLYSVVEGLTTLVLVLVIWYGTGQVLGSVITLGVLIGFINSLNRIFIPIREFAQQLSMIQRAMAALQHVHALFSVPSGDQRGQEEFVDLGPFQELVFDQVRFRYQPDGEEVLKGISFTLRQGQRIALVGATGSGKSTILRLLTQAYQGYQGSIRINGVELSQIPKRQVLGIMNLMHQDVYLFNESLKFNISLGREGIHDEKVVEAAQFVYAHEFIQELDEGYEFKVQDNGKNLSSGQAQLISFARAIAGQSELILLDEATSSVDSVTEDLIQKATLQIFSTKTVIAIAHRLSTIQHSDVILVMKNGEIVESGNHQNLIQQGGYYLSLLQQLRKEQAPSPA